MFTLRYKREAPMHPRPHQPTVPMFTTESEALAHLADQENSLDLEVVER